MKISELEAVLKTRREEHGDLDVQVTWEGTVHPLAPEFVYTGISRLDANGNFVPNPVPRTVLFIDGEDGGFRST
jgi:hypothetical protein